MITVLCKSTQIIIHQHFRCLKLDFAVVKLYVLLLFLQMCDLRGFLSIPFIHSWRF